jgi:hypothetical protein
VPAKRHIRKNRVGIAARIRILIASEASDSQEPLWNHSENANFECQRSVIIARVAWEMRILSDSEAPASQESLGNRSDNVNF